jgi:4-hydroxybenzoate polyprenyltransferase
VPATASNAVESPVERKSSGFWFLLKTARPGLWATSVWFYLLPLGGRHVFHLPGFWLGLLYVTFPLGLILYGWNDIADAECDRLNARKGTFLFGARGSSEQLRSLPLAIAGVQILFAVLFSTITGSRVLVWFLALAACTAIYNLPRYGLKCHPPFDILNQAAYLLVFVLSSWLNHVPELRWPAMAFGALFAMHSHVFGEIMDIEPDRMSQRTTTATVIGPIAAKLLIAVMLAIESLLVDKSFHDIWISAALAWGAVWFLLDATLLWRERAYSLNAMRFFMWVWNAVAIGSMPWVWSTASLTH